MQTVANYSTAGLLVGSGVSLWNCHK